MKFKVNETVLVHDLNRFGVREYTIYEIDVNNNHIYLRDQSSTDKTNKNPWYDIAVCSEQCRKLKKERK